jgi:hypothetical protein
VNTTPTEEVKDSRKSSTKIVIMNSNAYTVEMMPGIEVLSKDSEVADPVTLTVESS